MSCAIIYDRDKPESDLLRAAFGKISCFERDLSLDIFSRISDLEKGVSQLLEVSLLCVDFESNGDIAIKAVKHSHPLAAIIIIANAKTSPLLYVRPEIMPSGLMLRPLTTDQATKTLREVLDEIWKREQEEVFNGEVFSFSTREGTTRIPFSQILYFEARNKKIVLCTDRVEMEFYSTLEHLQKTLPSYFIRCHKGYLANVHLIRQIDNGYSYLQLVGDFRVPISRSYRTSVKEALA